MVLHVAVGTAPRGVSRTLAYLLLCRFSLLRPLSGVPGTQSRRPSSLKGLIPFRHLQLWFFTEKEIYWGVRYGAGALNRMKRLLFTENEIYGGVGYDGGALNRLKWLVHVLMLQWLWSRFDLIPFSPMKILCLVSVMVSSYPFEMIGSWPHIAMVVVLVCPRFPSLRYMLYLSPSWYRHIPVFTTVCSINYFTDQSSMFFPVEKVGQAETFESWPSEKGVISNWKTKKKTCPWLIRSRL